MSQADNIRFAELFARALAAGTKAGNEVIPAPMIVQGANLLDDKPHGKKYFVSEGVCGFAWVSFPGNTAFGRWAKKEGFAAQFHPKGLCYWVGNFGQSMERKEACARAMAKVLREGGIERVQVGSRMD